MRILLTFVVPYAFTGYYPVTMILGKDVAHSGICYLSPVIALIMGLVSYALWHMGVKWYNSTGA